MLKGVLCSTGALITRFNGRDPRLLAGFAPYIGCDGFELMLYPSWNEGGKLERYIDFLRGSGLKFPVLHADKQIGELLSMGGEDNVREADRRFEANCRAAAAVGSGLMVLHLWGGPASDKHIENNIAALGGYMALANELGITLTVENVICSMRSPLANMRSVLENYPEALFTFDTKMAEFHRELNASLEWEPLFYGGRAAHLHVNDYGGGYMDFNDLRVLHVGDGHADFVPFFDKVRAVGYSGWATVEATSVRRDGSIDFEKLNRTLRRVKKELG